VLVLQEGKSFVGWCDLSARAYNHTMGITKDISVCFTVTCIRDSGRPDYQFLVVGEFYQVQPLPGLVSGEQTYALWKTDIEYVPLHSADFRLFFGRA
jgi:hypothetical protein